MAKLSLRTRVAATFALLGLVVSICVAVIAVHFSDTYVHRLIDQMLRVEAESAQSLLAEKGPEVRLNAYHFSLYLETPDSSNPPPPELRALAPGTHELPDNEGERHVIVFQAQGHRAYVVMDIGSESMRERHLSRDLIALVLFGTLLSAWLGWIWAGRAIEPVRHLAHEVETLEPSPRGAASLAPGFVDDEVGALARAFDRYQERLYAFVRRERAFTADASHEIRTPLAVIRGAIEVMLDRGDASAADSARLKRMQRGGEELNDLLDALLVLARGEELDVTGETTVNLTDAVTRLVEERADKFREKHLQVTVDAASGVLLNAPSRVINVIVGNLLRAATRFAEGGDLRVKLTAAELRIACRHGTTDGGGEPGPVGGEPADRIPGLGMIQRVCERRGWTLTAEAGPDQSRFCLRFSVGVDPALGAHAEN